MKIGDCIVSNICSAMAGKISKIINGNLVMVVVSGVPILADMDFWHKVQS